MITLKTPYFGKWHHNENYEFSSLEDAISFLTYWNITDYIISAH